MTNNMKKIWNFALMAVLTVGLSFAVTSCKDDDKNENGGGTEQPTNAMDEEEGTAAWRWLCALTDADSLANDWQSQQYEPTIGVASTNQPNVRIVLVNDLAEAKAHFGSIADLTVKEIGQSATVSTKGMGTLTWNLSAAGAKNLATVDVNIKQMPHLERIVYCTPEQSPDNASTFGTAYFRLGDVVVDKDGYYWVCVRPAFSGVKDKSYWMNIINAAESGRDKDSGKLPGYPKNNLYDYSNRYHNNTIHLPTGLAYEHRHVRELSNFIWALLDPIKYHEESNSDGKGLGGFDYKYHGEKFLQRVAYHWDNFGIWEKLFNKTHQEMLTYTRNGEMNFFYNGKNWWKGSTARLWRYHSEGYEHEYNRKQSQDEKLYEMKAQNTGFDILRAAHDPNAASVENCPEPIADELHGSWVIRMKTGSELSTIKYSPTNDMGVRTVYRFNAHTVPATPTGSDLMTEDDFDEMSGGATPFNGEPYYHTGDVLLDENGKFWFVTYPSGMDFDHSPYSELVSLNALKLSSNEAYATNAPKQKEVLRGFTFLWFMIHNGYQATHGKNDKDLSKSGSLNYTFLKNIKDACKVDIRFLLQFLVEEENARSQTELCSLPYCLYNSGDAKQRLMRMVMTSDQGKNDVRFNYWESYPSTPSSTDKYYTNFSGVPIYLQDVAIQVMVDEYGKDYYATRPIEDFDHDGKTNRNYRKTADKNAEKLKNYIYNFDTWYNGTYNTDMWNSPVLAADYDAVLDRGFNNYQTKSVKGHTLTLWNPVPYKDNEEDQDPNSFSYQLLLNYWNLMINVLNDSFRIDGKTSTLPTYQEVWYNYKNLQ